MIVWHFCWMSIAEELKVMANRCMLTMVRQQPRSEFSVHQAKMVCSPFTNTTQSRTDGNMSNISKTTRSKVENALVNYSPKINYFSLVAKKEKVTCAR